MTTDLRQSILVKDFQSINETLQKRSDMLLEQRKEMEKEFDSLQTDLENTIFRLEGSLACQNKIV